MTRTLWTVTAIGAVMLAGVLSTPSPAASGGAYSLRDLGVLTGADRSEARGLNRRGDVVGLSGQGFFWRSGKGALLKPLPGASGSDAVAVNNRRRVLGVSTGFTQSPIRAVTLWDPDSQIVPNGLVGPQILPLALNDRSRIVGTDRAGEDAEYRAFYWSGGRRLELPLLPGFTASAATDVNNRGRVVGYCWTRGEGGAVTSGAFLWEHGRNWPLGALPLSSSRALAVNGRGDVVGESAGRLILWKRGRRLTDLGLLPGALRMEPTAINDRLEIVGQAVFQVGDTRVERPFLFRKGKFRLLKDMVSGAGDWSFTRPADEELPRRSGWVRINDRGQVTGTGTRDGQERAFLLSP